MLDNIYIIVSVRNVSFSPQAAASLPSFDEGFLYSSFVFIPKIVCEFGIKVNLSEPPTTPLSQAKT